MTKGLIDAGEQITISEGGRTVNFLTQKGKTVEQTLNDLETAINDAGLNVDLMREFPPLTDSGAPQPITLRHKEFGSEYTFQAASNTAGLVSSVSNIPETIATVSYTHLTLPTNREV